MPISDFNDKNNLKLGIITQSEIYEIPSSLKRSFKQKSLISKIAKRIVSQKTHHIYLIGAGSSYHAGYAMSYMFNRLTTIPTYTEFSMEFQYLIEPILLPGDCVVAISQSGKTLDTIESLQIAKEKGCLTISITNNRDSKLSNLSMFHIPLQAGEEKSVLATKTYVTELSILAMLALEIAKENEVILNETYNQIWTELLRIPDKIHSILPHLHKQIIEISRYFKFAEFCFILGSGPDYATALEAALKLKEGARMYGQAYSTAEFPHGPITLADSKTLILAIIPKEEDKRKKKIINLLSRIKERKSTTFGIYEDLEEKDINDSVDIGIQVPNTISDLQPLIMIIAIQLLTLEISRINGINCDTPKFLSKVSGI
jgi:glucosamine--fructose-6-phosphate aminotransferase (isomerizing)